MTSVFKIIYVKFLKRYTEEYDDGLNLFCEIPEKDMDIVKGILRLEKEA